MYLSVMGGSLKATKLWSADNPIVGQAGLQDGRFVGKAEARIPLHIESISGCQHDAGRLQEVDAKLA